MLLRSNICFNWSVRRGPGKSNNSKTECTLVVGPGSSRCRGADHAMTGHFVKRHCGMIGGWLLESDTTDDRGRIPQGLGRDAARIGGVGRACAVALKLEVAHCSACGLPEKAGTLLCVINAGF